LASPDICGISLLLFNLRKETYSYAYHPLTNQHLTEINFVLTVFFKTLIFDAILGYVLSEH